MSQQRPMLPVIRTGTKTSGDISERRPKQNRQNIGSETETTETKSKPISSQVLLRNRGKVASNFDLTMTEF